EAVACADELNVPALRSHALTMWVNVSFMYGLGVDQRSLDTAIELEDPDSGAHVTYRARAIDAVICSWTGRLEEAERKFAALRQQCEERGAEIEMNWVAHYATLNDIWLGRYREAARAADETMQRAVQIGGHQVVVIASMLQSLVAAFAGREEDARRTAGRAIDDARRGGGDFLAIAPTMSLGFLEVSLGNHSAALTVLQPLLADFDPVHSTEIMVGGYLPDAVEALIAVGRSTDAEPLIAALEDNGARLDRPWMLAVGARCRALWSSARGDLDSAVATAERAMVAHQRLPMPFERARTQLLLGQLQRRQRQKDVAAATLAEALAAFDELGTPLWAERARAELARVKVTRQGAGLTPSEQQVAELAAAGMTNTDIGAALFISPKTVEVNLTRTYRKLGIRSRAQLANSLNTPTEAAQE
ncbi:MAG: LuxR C-terminal-related transcriptional regulator, partial [Mycobacterium sp.]